MGNKNLVNHIIEKNGALKFSDTKPELFVGEILAELGYSFSKNELNLYDETGKNFHLRPDFMIFKASSSTYARRVIEVQGPYHYTKIQKKKTEWRVKILNGLGYAVILVPFELCEKKFRVYLKEELKKGIEGKEMKVEIVA